MWNFIRKLYFEHVVDEGDGHTRGLIAVAVFLVSVLLALTCLGLWLF